MSYAWDEATKSFVWVGDAPEPLIGQTKQEYADYALDFEGAGAAEYQASVLETMGVETFEDLPNGSGPGPLPISEGGGQGTGLSLAALLFLG